MADFEKQPEENPYAAPVASSGSSTYVHRASGTWVKQVRIVAILMAVQGALEFLFGLYFVAMGFISSQHHCHATESDKPIASGSSSNNFERHVHRVRGWRSHCRALGNFEIRCRNPRF